MTKLTTERLGYYAELPTEPAERKAIFMYEVRCMARQLLAYEQAGKETKIYQYQSCLFNDENGETDWYWDDCDKGFFEQYDPAHRRIVYAAQVLPKQTEPVDLSQQVEMLNRILNWILKELPVPTQKATVMAIRLSSVIDIISELEVSASAQPVIPAEKEKPKYDPTTQLDPHVYRELVNDLRDVALEYHGAQQLRERISRTLSKAITAAHPHFAQPVIPEEKSAIHGTKDPEDIAFNNGFVAGWNCCRSEVISLNETTAQPVSEPYKLISVKDDTPTESGDYWCYLGKDFESPTKYRVVHFDVRHHEFQDHRVTHWMRLPAEPEQEV